MTKSFKMVLLEAWLELDGLTKPPSVATLAQRSWDVLHRRPSLLGDLPEAIAKLPDGLDERWLRYWRDNPVNAWVGGNRSAAASAFLRVGDDRFSLAHPFPAGEAVAAEGLLQELAAYVVDATADVVTELASEGTDTIQSSVTITSLAANVENLTLTGTGTCIRTWNALHALNLTNCDAGVTPTHWQLSRHPEIFQPKITVQHEGIPCHVLGPDPNAQLTMPRGVTLKAGDPVISYVARNLEPYRGFHVFMRALELIQQRHPTAHAVIVGGDDVSYGRRPGDAPNWREKMLREVRLDPQRTHFVGRVPYATYAKLLQVSAAHLYLSYPFVLSWSLLEAMACGAPIVGSDTAPVRELIRDGVNGKLVNFFDPNSIALGKR